MQRFLIQVAGTALVLGLGACGGDESNDSARAAAPGDGAFENGPQTSMPGSAGSGAAGLAPSASQPPTMAPGMMDPSTLPPEVELEVDLQLPQASEHYVYAMNAEVGTVAVIDAATQAIHTIETGDRPMYLRTLAGSDGAIVLNIGSTRQTASTPTASVIRTRDGTSTSTNIEVVSGANAIGVAPDAKHAVVYYNANYASATSGSGSFQDVSVLMLDGGDADHAVNMTVGFRPRALFFSSDGKRAYVVTEDGVSVLDFAAIERDGSGIARLVTFGDVDLKALDVAITPDGRFALARAEGQSQLHLVELNGAAPRRTLDLANAYRGPEPEAEAEADAGVPALPFAVTDLDVLPDGKTAIAVLRNQRAIMTIPLPGGFDDASQATTIPIAQEIVGSVTVSADGKHALLYTTAVEIERLTIVELGTDAAPRTVALRKAVQAVTFTPDDKNALITHTRVEGDPNQPGISPDLKLDRSHGYSLLRVASGDVKLQSTEAQLGPTVMVPDSTYLFILFRNDAVNLREVHRVSLSSFLVDPITQLENAPVSIGVAPASHSVFINLRHPDGRMTFIDWNEPAAVKTVTGFELNSRIRN